MCLSVCVCIWKEWVVRTEKWWNVENNPQLLTDLAGSDQSHYTGAHQDRERNQDGRKSRKGGSMCKSLVWLTQHCISWWFARTGRQSKIIISSMWDVCSEVCSNLGMARAYQVQTKTNDHFIMIVRLRLADSADITWLLFVSLKLPTSAKYYQKRAIRHRHCLMSASPRQLACLWQVCVKEKMKRWTSALPRGPC